MKPHQSVREDVPRTFGWEAYCAAARTLASRPQPQREIPHANPKKDTNDAECG